MQCHSAWLCSFLLICLFQLTGCGGSSQEIDGFYQAHTEDGVALGMRRYRPSSDHQYRTGRPVLLLPGIVNNINQFDVRSTLGKPYGYQLPADAPAWAQNDSTIAQDNIKFFSMAHYLYLRGYDVWMANFRGVGRDAYASESGHNNTNLDVWCLLDFPVAVEKVVQVTGKKPVIGGFSTGALCAYQYLQGATLNADIVQQGKYIPHVTASDALAWERNQKVAGFIGLDPAGSPKLAYHGIINSPLGWGLLTQNAKVDLDKVLPVALSLLPPVVLAGATDLLFKTISNLANAFPAFLPSWADLFGALNIWSTGNTNGYVEDFMVRHGLSSFYIKGLGQYAEWGINGEVREHWQNGEENQKDLVPDTPALSDGYYYYSDALDRMTVPALSIFSQSPAAVETHAMVDLIYGGKTYHPLDQWMEIAGTAHVDLVIGNHAPYVSFPAMADWLDSL